MDLQVKVIVLKNKSYLFNHTSPVVMSNSNRDNTIAKRYKQSQQAITSLTVYNIL
jgi:hypothetical protein